MSEPIFQPEWVSASMRFPCVGERVVLPAEVTNIRPAYRQSTVFATYGRVDDDRERGTSSGHVNGVWWTAPAATFVIGETRMEPCDAERLAKWILMMVGKPVKEADGDRS